MFKFGRKEKVQDQPPVVITAPAQHWPVLSATYKATSGELPDVNVTVTHQSPGILTVHVTLALTPIGWSIEDATPYGVSPGSESAEFGIRVASLNIEVRQLNLDEYNQKRERRKKASVIETSFGLHESDAAGPARKPPEFITMHLNSHTAAKAGYRQGRHWIDNDGRFNFTLISKDLMPNRPRHTQSVQVEHERHIEIDLPGEARMADEEARYPF